MDVCVLLELLVDLLVCRLLVSDEADDHVLGVLGDLANKFKLLFQVSVIGLCCEEFEVAYTKTARCACDQIGSHCIGMQVRDGNDVVIKRY
jgi:hypothetical protein